MSWWCSVVKTLYAQVSAQALFAAHRLFTPRAACTYTPYGDPHLVSLVEAHFFW